MTNGFSDNKLKVIIKEDELGKLLKQYNINKKDMNSSLYEVKKIDGTEKLVSELLNEIKDNPIQ